VKVIRCLLASIIFNQVLCAGYAQPLALSRHYRAPVHEQYHSQPTQDIHIKPRLRTKAPSPKELTARLQKVSSETEESGDEATADLGCATGEGHVAGAGGLGCDTS